MTPIDLRPKIFEAVGYDMAVFTTD